MLQSLSPTLPGHIQSVFIQNVMKLYSRIAQTDTDTDLLQEVIGKLETLVSSPHLEVQERASSTVTILK